METLQRTANRGSISTGYDIENSLKFEADNTETLSKTFSSDGNKQTWTVSFWVKRTELSTDQMVFSAEDTYFYFLTSDVVRINTRGATNYFFDTSAVFRDTSAWYHFVVRVDTTNATAADRTRLYVNGVEFSSSTSSYENNTGNTGWNDSAKTHVIGNYTSGSYHLCGYLAEFHSIDGQSLAPTDFGEFDEDTGIWKPKAYTGSYGTNGFYLDFESSGSLGADSSGNGNNFTANNITAADQATDTPTNNFCTFNIITAIGTSTYTEGGTVAQANKTNDLGEGTMMFSSGNWYFEMQVPSSSFSNDAMFGFGVPNEWGLSGGNPGDDYKSFSAHSLGRWYYNNNGHTSTDTSAAFAKGDIVSIAINTSSQKAWVAVNGTWATGTNPATGTGGFSYGTLITDWESGDYLVPAFRTHITSGSKSNANFGGYTTISISSAASDANGYGTFEYAPPSGYYALCTKNLAEYG